jgi:SPRY domain
MVDCVIAGPSFGPGDVVGCGLDHTQGAGVAADIFFTLNGKYIGVAFTAVSKVLCCTSNYTVLLCNQMACRFIR